MAMCSMMQDVFVQRVCFGMLCGHGLYVNKRTTQKKLCLRNK